VDEAGFESWNSEMVPGSRAALVYSRWVRHFRNATFGDEFYGAGLDRGYYPRFWTLQQLPADSDWFDDERTAREETRADIAARAMNRTVTELDEEGWETYGDYARTEIGHPFPVSFLDYPAKPIAGAPFALSNFRPNPGGTPAGSSWRLVAGPDSAEGIIPGGNSGRYFSPHYADQLERWRTGQYKLLTFDAEGGPDIVFVDGGGS
jgi:penicillin amidase